MDIEFELENNKLVNVIVVQDGQRKKVGHIFTPGGSGRYIKNAIQVCGITSAFDYWGCALFARNSDKDKVVARLTENHDPYVQVKDIQLKFDWDVEPHRTKHDRMDQDCLGCYNSPCTCDNESLRFTEDEVDEGKGKDSTNRYKLKRAADLDLEEVGKDE